MKVKEMHNKKKAKQKLKQLERKKRLKRKQIM